MKETTKRMLSLLIAEASLGVLNALYCEADMLATEALSTSVREEAEWFRVTIEAEIESRAES